jgi:hypothetical protein
MPGVSIQRQPLLESALKAHILQISPRETGRFVIPALGANPVQVKWTHSHTPHLKLNSFLSQEKIIYFPELFTA